MDAVNLRPLAKDTLADATTDALPTPPVYDEIS